MIHKKGQLSAKRVELLNKIGFNWDPYVSQWQQCFEALRAYQKEHGHCKVPKDYCQSGIRLGMWVSTQRASYKKGLLQNDRLQLLNELGFHWDPFADQWHENFEKLKQYKALKGHCRVPLHHPEDPILGGWVVSQRYLLKKNKLPLDRITLLKSLGFI